MLKQLVKLAAVIAAATALQRLGNAAALAERGYFAVGDEMFIFPTVLVVGYYITGIHAWEVRQRNKRRRERRRYEQCSRAVRSEYRTVDFRTMR